MEAAFLFALVILVFPVVGLPFRFLAVGSVPDFLFPLLEGGFELLAVLELPHVVGRGVAVAEFDPIILDLAEDGHAVSGLEVADAIDDVRDFLDGVQRHPT